MTTLDLLAFTLELSKKILDSNIANVYHLKDRDAVIFRFKSKDKEIFDLRFDIGRWLRLTNYYFEPPRQVSPWCKELRKIVKNSKVESIDQPSFDRYIVIKLSKGPFNYKLILELMNRGNIILSEDNKIITIYRPVRTRDRILTKGSNYLPPPMNFIDPRRALPIEIKSVFEKSKAGVVQTIVRFLGVPGEVAEEVCARLSLDKKIKARKLDLNTITKISEILREIIECYKDIKKPMIVVDHDNKPLSVIPCNFLIYRNYEKRYYNSYLEALDDYVEFIIKFEETTKESRLINEKKAKILETIRRQRQLIEEYSKRAKVLKNLADELSLKMWELDNFLRRILEIAKYEGWEKAFLQIKNYWKMAYRISKIDKVSKKLVINIDDNEIEIDLKSSASQIIEKLYNEAKKLRRKAERATQHLNKLKEDLKKIKAEIDVKVQKPKKPVTRWYENFHWFISSEGFLVIGGRDASQNEALIKKYMSNNDIVFHADIHGSPFVIIKDARDKCSERTLLEAAQLTASYSKAWSLGFASLDVYWVFPEQVSKTAPTGTFLKKGSFMIYGKKNYIRSMPLKLAVGIMIEDNWAKIITGPPEPISKRAIAYVLIEPGELSREETAHKIAEILLRKIKNYEIVNKKNIKSNIKSRLPGGKFRLRIT